MTSTAQGRHAAARFIRDWPAGDVERRKTMNAATPDFSGLPEAGAFVAQLTGRRPAHGEYLIKRWICERRLPMLTREGLRPVPVEEDQEFDFPASKVPDPSGILVLNGNGMAARATLEVVVDLDDVKRLAYELAPPSPTPAPSSGPPGTHVLTTAAAAGA